MLIVPSLLQHNTNDDSTAEAKELRHQYFLTSNALDRFRKRWSQEYLASLREKHTNQCAKKPTHHLKPGILVMVRHDNMHGYEWALDRIVRVFLDPLGVIRTAERGGGWTECYPLSNHLSASQTRLLRRRRGGYIRN